MRFLCLHGMGTNGQIFEAQISSIRNQLVGQHEFVFPEGEVECEPAPGVDLFYPGPFKCFYDLPTNSAVEEALEYVDDIIEDEGPFDGVIGFSQGAALASSYILQDSKLPHPKNPFKCAIFFCASMPFDIDSEAFTVSSDGTCRRIGSNEPIKNFAITKTIPEASSLGYSGKFDEDTEFLRRYIPGPGEKAFIQIATTHIIGATDQYNPQSSLLRRLCCPNNMQLLEHRGGHEIPKDRNTTVKMTTCIQNMLYSVLVG